jgi:hypothetical protein
MCLVLVRDGAGLSRLSHVERAIAFVFRAVTSHPLWSRAFFQCCGHPFMFPAIRLHLEREKFI